jgi:hypothetical protein
MDSVEAPDWKNCSSDQTWVDHLADVLSSGEGDLGEPLPTDLVERLGPVTSMTCGPCKRSAIRASRSYPSGFK